MKQGQLKVNLKAPELTVLCTGVLELDVPAGEYAEGEMRSLVVKSGNVQGENLSGKVVPTISVVWKTDRGNLSPSIDSNIIIRVGKLIDVTAIVYGTNDKVLYARFETGNPKYLWLNYTMAYVELNRVENGTVEFTCYRLG